MCTCLQVFQWLRSWSVSPDRLDFDVRNALIPSENQTKCKRLHRTETLYWAKLENNSRYRHQQKYYQAKTDIANTKQSSKASILTDGADVVASDPVDSKSHYQNHNIQSAKQRYNGWTLIQFNYMKQKMARNTELSKAWHYTFN